MTSRKAVDDFLSQKRLGVVGVSRGGKKFGNTIYKELQTKGYQVVPINPHADTIDGQPCYPNVQAVPEPLDGIVVTVKPAETEKVVKEAAEAGIRHIWMQQGSESKTAIRFCEEQDIPVIAGECILMFAEPVATFHKFHRWLWGLFGKLPR
jgi:predicted CoA-binding protein